MFFLKVNDMKKITGLLLVVVMMSITACEGPMGPPGKDGKDGYETEWFVNDYNVLSHQWNLTFDDMMGSFFEYEVPIPQLTSFVFTDGAVLIYLVQDIFSGGRTVQVNSPLPYTYYYESNDFFYSENYSFELRPGYINFIVKYSDFDTNEKPATCRFHVVMIW